MTGLARTAALCTVAALAAACTSEQTSTPGPTLTSTTSTTTTTTIAGPTETTTVETTDTTAAPTTAAPTTAPGSTLPAGPTGDSLQFYLGGVDPGLLPLGSWDGGAWTDPPADPDPPGGGTELTVSRLAGTTAGTVDGSAEACFDGRVGPTITPAAGEASPPAAGYSAVALTAPGWPLQPRRIVDVADPVPDYQGLAEAVFAGADVDATAGSIVQTIVTDLDGDGNTEALVVFESIDVDPGPGTPGELSAVLLIDTESRATSTVLRSFVPPDDGDPTTFDVIDRFRILDVADYNGDGRMEVAVNNWYFEGAGVIVYEFENNELNQILAASCGL